MTPNNSHEDPETTPTHRPPLGAVGGGSSLVRTATESDAGRVVQLHHEAFFLERGNPRRDQACAEVGTIWDETNHMSLCYQLAKLASLQLMGDNLAHGRTLQDTSGLDDYGYEEPDLYLIDGDGE
jgi:hypothetical protein